MEISSRFLGVRALRGRALIQDDERSTGALPIVLSHAFWKRHFQSDARVVGRPIWLQGRDATVVGIAPQEFTGASIDTSPDVWLPLNAAPTLSSDIELKRLEGLLPDLLVRLRPGVTFAQAKAEFDRIWNAHLNSNLPPEIKSWESRFHIELQSAARGVSRLRNQFSSALIFLMSAAGLLLLIVCANLAGLLLARGAARRQEMAVRVAIGASTGRLIRQMLTESMLLVWIGGASGILLAFASTPIVMRTLPPMRHIDATSLPIAIRIEADLHVLGFSLLLCALTAVFFGLGPACHIARRDSYSPLKCARSTRRWTIRHILVIAQITLSTFLLIGAGLLLATFERLRRVDPGFDSGRVVTRRSNYGLRARKDTRPQATDSPTTMDPAVRTHGLCLIVEDPSTGPSATSSGRSGGSRTGA